ncbi:MAG: 4Fe-4S binding protein [Candidatus Hermodarchaeota archaeon]
MNTLSKVIIIKEKFIPVQINQEQCLRCERCLHACKQKAIYFEHGIRKVDYAKCKACLNCVQVCPRNAIQVTSITTPNQIVSIKIDHEKCSMCELCLDENGKFCPKHLFYKDKVKKVNREEEGIRYKFKEISKCQGCLKCELSCPEGAIEAVTFDL